jgi:hypothetical protein
MFHATACRSPCLKPKDEPSDPGVLHTALVLVRPASNPLSFKMQRVRRRNPLDLYQYPFYASLRNLVRDQNVFPQTSSDTSLITGLFRLFSKVYLTTA